MLRTLKACVILVCFVQSVFAWCEAAAVHWQGSQRASVPAELSADPQLRAHRSLRQSAAEAKDTADHQASARAILREAPLDAAAMRAVALSSPRSDGSAQLALSERISRRDALTQLHLFERAAEEGRDEEGLVHLDRLLSVVPAAGKELFPPLAALLPNRDARQALAAYSRRVWFQPFMQVAADEAPAVAAVVDLGERANLPASQWQNLLPKLLERSLDEGDYRAARQVAVEHGGARLAAIDSFALTPATLDPRFAPLTWRTSAGSASRIAPAPNGALQVTLTPEKTQLLLTRTTGLSAGPYSLSQSVGASTASGDPRLIWAVSCLGSGKARPFWRQIVPVNAGSTNHRSQLVVPADCPLQSWSLSAYLDGQQGEGAFTLADLELTAVR
jgi:hypothetical protein